VVNVEKRRPAANEITFEAITQPFQIIATTADTTDISFRLLPHVT
jgi:hypothetical protein